MQNSSSKTRVLNPTKHLRFVKLVNGIAVNYFRNTFHLDRVPNTLVHLGLDKLNFIELNFPDTQFYLHARSGGQKIDAQNQNARSIETSVRL